MIIAKRLIFVLTVPLVALATIAVLTRHQLSRIEAQARFVAESQVASLALLGDVSRASAELRVNVRSYLLANDPPGRAAARALFDEDEQTVTQLLQQYGDSLVTGDSDRRLYIDYRDLLARWTSAAKSVMELADQGRGEAALALLTNEVAAIGLRFGRASSDWIRHNNELASTSGKDAIMAIERSRLRLLVTSLGALLLTAALGRLTFRRIVTPIQALETSVKTIAGGDFTQPVPFTQANDETGSLARSVDVLKRGAGAMEEQRWIKSYVSRLAGELQAATTLSEFGQSLLSDLVPLLGGGVAGCYVFEEKSNRLRRAASYGLAEGAEGPESLALGEGLVDSVPATAGPCPPPSCLQVTCASRPAWARLPRRMPPPSRSFPRARCSASGSPPGSAASGRASKDSWTNSCRWSP
jgi:CHASE3 domain sensor protein